MARNAAVAEVQTEYVAVGLCRKRREVVGSAARRAYLTRSNRRLASPVAHRRPWHADLACDCAVINSVRDQTMSCVELLGGSHDLKLCGATDSIDLLGGRIGTPRAWRNLVYAMDLGSIVFGHGGSSPPARTLVKQSYQPCFAK